MDLLLRFASKLDKTQLEGRTSDDDSRGGGPSPGTGPVTKFLRIDSKNSWKGCGKPNSSDSMMMSSVNRDHESRRSFSPCYRNKSFKFEGERRIEVRGREDEGNDYDEGRDGRDDEEEEEEEEEDGAIIVDQSQSLHRISSAASLARTYEDDQYGCYDIEEENEPSIGLSLTEESDSISCNAHKARRLQI